MEGSSSGGQLRERPQVWEGLIEYKNLPKLHGEDRELVFICTVCTDDPKAHRASHHAFRVLIMIKDARYRALGQWQYLVYTDSHKLGFKCCNSESKLFSTLLLVIRRRATSLKLRAWLNPKNLKPCIESWNPAINTNLEKWGVFGLHFVHSLLHISTNRCVRCWCEFCWWVQSDVLGFVGKARCYQHCILGW